MPTHVKPPEGASVLGACAPDISGHPHRQEASHGWAAQPVANMAGRSGVALAPRNVVIDTNVVLDLWLYNDPRTELLREELASERWHWIATPSMREELRRVLAYPHIARRLADNAATPLQASLPQIARPRPQTHRALCVAHTAEEVLARFDAHTTPVATASAIAFRCKDADDQKFIDLAAAHAAVLLSKDKAVLRMKKRLATLGVACAATLGDLTDR